MDSDTSSSLPSAKVKRICSDFDETINTTFNYPNDFSPDALTRFLTRCGVKTTAQPADILLSLNVAKVIDQSLQLTHAGVLFFAQSPQNFYPEGHITAVRYQSYDRFSIVDKKDFKGSPIDQIESTMDFIRRHISVATHIAPTPGALGQRQEVYDYPLTALREAVVNAVAHRDYRYDHSHIYVHIYPDRIEFENPGGLVGGLSVDKLGTRSIRRNRLIADLLHRAHYIERVGSGFDRMRQTLQENQNPNLAVSATNFFNLRFYKRVATAQADQISVRGVAILSAMEASGVMTKSTVAQLLSVSDDTALREINALIDHGLIERTGVGKAIVYRMTKESP